MSESSQTEHELALQMVPLLERGAEAFRVHCAAGSSRDRRAELVAPATFSVVTQEDYVAHPLLCLQHALVDRPLHILLREPGALFASLAKLTRR